MKKLSLGLYFLTLCLYSIFSYSLTDPNLVLTSWRPYWQFQQWMWQTFFKNAPLLSLTYVALITLLFVCYFAVCCGPFGIMSKTHPKKSYLWWYLAACIPLFFSYNALSHDVFNYIFNAKMVWVYHVNPHQSIALNFPNDLWLRFMNNTHTPAPYGYGWTVISLIPSVLGLEKFTSTWLLFRAFNLFSVSFLFFAFFEMIKAEQHKNKLIWPFFFIVILNPLFLIEVVSNSHNDVWMMAPAILSLGVLHQTKKLDIKKILISLLLLCFSISIKLSTLVLTPIWIAVFFEEALSSYQLPKNLRQLTSFIHLHYADLSALLLFIPLLTPRSQQFNSWYLVWLIVWLPFMRWNWAKGGILVLSFSSMYRYVPWLIAGHFTDQILLQQKMITWIPLVIYLIGYGSIFLFTRTLRHSRVE